MKKVQLKRYTFQGKHLLNESIKKDILFKIKAKPHLEAFWFLVEEYFPSQCDELHI